MLKYGKVAFAIKISTSRTIHWKYKLNTAKLLAFYSERLYAKNVHYPILFCLNRDNDGKHPANAFHRLIFI